MKSPNLIVSFLVLDIQTVGRDQVARDGLGAGTPCCVGDHLGVATSGGFGCFFLSRYSE